MDKEVANKIKKVMSSVFGVSIDQIHENVSPDVIESWDSLRHMNLIVALEEEFEIEFSDDEIGDLLNYNLIKMSIEEKI